MGNKPVKYKSEDGKEYWFRVELNTEFSEDFFCEYKVPYTKDVCKYFHSNLGSITVLDRETGFSHGYGGFQRDIETGYRDKNGEFWLASGDFDIIENKPKTFGDAIAMIKSSANNCIGAEKPAYKELAEENAELKDTLLATCYHKNGSLCMCSKHANAGLDAVCDLNNCPYLKKSK